MKPFLVLAALAGSLALTATDVGAQTDARSGLQSIGLRSAYGLGDRHNLQFVSLLPRASWFLPQIVDEPLARYNCQAEFIVEGIASYITSNRTETMEAGVNPIVFSFRYDRGQALVPFLEGGEGVLYTALQGEHLGGSFQFSSQAGGGLHWFLSRTAALTASYRIRHISNAGIRKENSGLNTDFFTVGFTFFPKR
ncbi:MAG TPA: acyloxyacyl hydrolase [Candidatus Kryptonia bacterium]|nr:acyloxyacyl hydrolase [Candidatus Kryptonia bacterium]